MYADGVNLQLSNHATQRSMSQLFNDQSTPIGTWYSHVQSESWSASSLMYGDTSIIHSCMMSVPIYEEVRFTHENCDSSIQKQQTMSVKQLELLINKRNYSSFSPVQLSVDLFCEVLQLHDQHMQILSLLY